jgi:putative inorganic carbon (hco3(-)) transporter
MIDALALNLFLAALPFEQFSALGVTILKLAGGLAFVVWLFSRLRSDEPVRWDPGLTLMLLFMFWGTASGLWSIDPAWSLGKLPTYLLLLLSYFLIVNVIRNEKQFSQAMIALWLGTLLLLTSGAMDMANVKLRGEEYRISGILGNPNGYVAVLVALIPSGYWFFARTRAPMHRVVAVGALVVAGLTSIYTQSRGGVISIAVFFLALFGFRQTRWRAVILAGLAALLVLRVAPLSFWQRWEEAKAEGGDERTRELWPAGIRAFAQHPVTGSGLGTNAVALYQVGGTRAPWRVVHNAPLAVAIELGLPGLALYLGFIAYALVRLLRALSVRMRQGSSKETAFAAVLLASFAAYLTNWFKGGGMEEAKMLWVLLGLMSAYARILEGTSGTAEEDDSVSEEPNPA